MDISEMIAGGNSSVPARETTAPEESDNELASLAPQELDPPDIPAASATMAPVRELSAVERIRAFRDGTLTPPMIGGVEEGSESGGSGAAVHGGDGGDGGEDGGGEGDVPLPDGADDEGVGEVSSPGGEVESLRSADGVQQGSRMPRIPRKFLLIGVPAAVVLIGAGVAIPGLGGHDSGGTATMPQSAGVPAQSSTSSAAPAVVPDAVIQPASVDAPEYPISVTPPMDAFSEEKGKGWVCAGLDGTILTITLPTPMVVTEIDVMPGIDGTDADGADLWAKHRLVTRVSFLMDYGDPVPGEFTDKRELQPTQMHSAVTKTIRVVVLETTDVSGKGPTADAGTSAAPSPGLLGSLGSLNLGASTAPTGGQDTRPATFAIGSIQILGHKAA